MSTVSRIVISVEYDQLLELLRHMDAQGCEPVGFRSTSAGCEVTFTQTPRPGISSWRYDWSQEGGPIMFTAMVLDTFAELEKAEIVFCFRASQAGADPEGGYVRFIYRRPQDASLAEVGRWEHCLGAYPGPIRKRVRGGWRLIGRVQTWNGSRFSGPEQGIYKRLVVA